MTNTLATLNRDQMFQILAAILAGTSATPGTPLTEVIARYNEIALRLSGRYKEPPMPIRLTPTGTMPMFVG